MKPEDVRVYIFSFKQRYRYMATVSTTGSYQGTTGFHLIRALLYPEITPTLIHSIMLSEFYECIIPNLYFMSGRFWPSSKELLLEHLYLEF